MNLSRKIPDRLSPACLKKRSSGEINMNAAGKVILILGVIFIILAVVWSVFTFTSLQQPLQEVYNNDKSLKGILAEAKYGGFMKRDTLIFNLKKVPGDAEVLGPFKYLFKYLVKLEDQGKNFDRILIQYRGKTCYVLDGTSIHDLAAQSYLNKVETIALNFPPMLKSPDGKPSFSQPHGDPQYVLQKKLHNFNDFCDKWFLINMSKQVKEKQKKGSGKEEPGKTKKEPGMDESPESPGEQPPEKPPKASPIIPEIPEDIPGETPNNIDASPEMQVSPEPESSPEPNGEVPPIEPEEI